MRWDFATIMVLLVVVSGGIWAFDALVLGRRRRMAVAGDGADGAADGGPGEVAAPRQSAIVEYARSFFPVFLIVLVLRSFLIEPFRIPSNSMMPTLLTGDFIAVNKFIYGIRLPVSDKKILKISRPKRGDVVVFRYPEDPSIPFIKRVVGLPGDTIGYYNKTVYVNGSPAVQQKLDTYIGKGSGRGMTGFALLNEQLGDKKHLLLYQSGSPSRAEEWTVPAGQYFVLGDNRDNSRDSRFWGFVPDENLIGKAFAIWMNWDWGHGLDWSRIGMSIR